MCYAKDGEKKEKPLVFPAVLFLLFDFIIKFFVFSDVIFKRKFNLHVERSFFFFCYDF